MREIKFRAWDEISKSWVYFDLDDAISGRIGREGYSALRLINKTQYTGLKDRRGVEIYEGDIIKLDPRLHPFYPDVTIIGQVFWNNFESEWQHTYYDNRPPKKMFRSCEVIGNIYENPELLK